MKEYCLLAGFFVCLLKSKDTTRLLSVLVGEVASFFSSQFRSLLYLQGDINRTCPHPGRPRGTGSDHDLSAADHCVPSGEERELPSGTDS